MTGNSYVDSQPYETFIRLGRLCERGMEYGANNSLMKNLIDVENGIAISYIKQDKQLLVVKEHLLAAIDFAITRDDISKEDKDRIKKLIPQIKAASTSGELLLICNDGNNIFRRYKLS